MCAAVVNDLPDPFSELLLRYSCFRRLTKAVAWLLRFRTWLLNKRVAEFKRQLEVTELVAAEQVVVRSLQGMVYKEELNALRRGKEISKSSTIYKLEPVLDCHGILRLTGRLKQAPIADVSKNQMILPRDHHVSKLIVRQVHEELTGHSGREYVLSVVREKFWIPKPRPLINKVLEECVVCRRLRGLPGEQRMADLPAERITPNKPPFSYVGVDCFGPFLVKRGRVREKRYGCLFYMSQY